MSPQGPRLNASRSSSEDAGEPGTSKDQNQNLKRKGPGSNDTSETASKKQRLEFSKCPICLKKMKQRDELTSTPCAHVFCTICLLTSYEYSKTCPLCRLPVEDDSGSGQEKGDEDLVCEECEEVVEVDDNETVGNHEGDDGNERDADQRGEAEDDDESRIPDEDDCDEDDND